MPRLKGRETRSGRSGPQMILKKALQNYTFCGAFFLVQYPCFPFNISRANHI